MGWLGLILIVVAILIFAVGNAGILYTLVVAAITTAIIVAFVKFEKKAEADGITSGFAKTLPKILMVISAIVCLVGIIAFIAGFVGSSSHMSGLENCDYCGGSGCFFCGGRGYFVETDTQLFGSPGKGLILALSAAAVFVAGGCYSDVKIPIGKKEE